MCRCLHPHGKLTQNSVATMKRETEKQAERESGTRKDVEMGKHAKENLHEPKHEMGTYSNGTEYHDCHRK